MGNFIAKNRDNRLVEKMNIESNLASPRPFSSISNEELATFVGVFIPGGHAPLTDLGDNPDLGRILLHFHNSEKPTGEFTCFLINTHDSPRPSSISYALPWPIRASLDEVCSRLLWICVQRIQDYFMVRCRRIAC